MLSWEAWLNTQITTCKRGFEEYAKLSLYQPDEISHSEARKMICDVLKGRVGQETWTVNLWRKRKWTQSHEEATIHATVSAFSFSWLRFLPGQLNETLPAPADKRLQPADRAMWVCSFHAWRASLAATSQPNVLISLGTSRGEESRGVMCHQGLSVRWFHGCLHHPRLPDLLKLCVLRRGGDTEPLYSR